MVSLRSKLIATLKGSESPTSLQPDVVTAVKYQETILIAYVLATDGMVLQI